MQPLDRPCSRSGEGIPGPFALRAFPDDFSSTGFGQKKSELRVAACWRPNDGENWMHEMRAVAALYERRFFSESTRSHNRQSTFDKLPVANFFTAQYSFFSSIPL